MEQKEIVLVNPAHREWANTLPLGLAYLAAVSKKAGYHVAAIDAQALSLDAATTAQLVCEYQPKLVGITATTPQIKEAWKISQNLKKSNPEIKVVLGGVHPTALPEESLIQEGVDFVVRGEGEQSFLELVETILHKKETPNLKGLSFRKGKDFIHLPPRERINDLNSLPFPSREIFDFPEKYFSPYTHRKRFATLITSRGCPGKCIFCNKNIFGSEFRSRSAENVISEIEYLYHHFAIQEFHIVDDCFTWDLQRLEEFCRILIKKNMEVTWACSNGIRVDRGDFRIFKLMRQAGCYRVSFGVESGNNEVLKQIGKDIDLKKIKNAFQDARKAGLTTVAFFMLGNYSENQKTLQQTIKFAKHLNPDYAQFSLAVPYPGTVLFEIVKSKGRFLTLDWDDYAISKNKVVFELPGISPEVLKKMYRRAYREFYLRPEQILRIISDQMKNFSFTSFYQLKISVAEVVKRMLIK